jgi:APA family basic amino acid/polyamine antiporter
MVLRLRQPNLERKFRVPFGPYVIPLLGAFSSLSLIATSDKSTLYRLFGWMGVGWLVYFSYGFKRADPDRDHRPEYGQVEGGEEDAARADAEAKEGSSRI